MPHATPRRPKRSPRTATWKAELTPMQRETADRWLAEAGQADFAAITSAYASAERKPGPDYLAERWPLLLEMQRLRLSEPSSSAFAAARKVAGNVTAKSIPGLPAEDSLRRWLTGHYPMHEAKLAAQLRREADAKREADLDAFVGTLQAIWAVLHSPAVTEWFGDLNIAANRAGRCVEAVQRGIAERLMTSFADAAPPRLTTDT